MQCFPTHEGPFFFERTGVARCDACRALVTRQQVREAAAALQDGEDGNLLQIEQIEARAIVARNDRLVTGPELDGRLAAIGDDEARRVAGDWQTIDAEHIFASS